MKKILINASNLHVGGGVQVATSIIGELAKFEHPELKISIWASSSVHKNIKQLKYTTELFSEYKILNTYGIKSIFSPKFYLKTNDFDIVVTVFGPLYSFLLNTKHISGFAQPWIIYPDNEIYKNLPLTKKVATRIKFLVQKFFFKRSDLIVAELEHVKRKLLEQKIGKPDTTFVIHNCISSIYTTPEHWKPIKKITDKNKLRLGFLGRNYPHKNTTIIPNAIKILKERYNISAEFFVTFTDDEWSSCSEEFKKCTNNLGPLTVAQCPSFYRQMDAIVFPSLLECFSATPLEAMAMEKPLFASDRDFNRDICKDYAYYFDPLSPESAAKAIADVFLKGGPDPNRLKLAKEHAFGFSNPRDRAQKYLSLLLDVADNKIKLKRAK